MFHNPLSTHVEIVTKFEVQPTHGHSMDYAHECSWSMEHFCLGCGQILVVILKVDLKTWTSFSLIIFYATMEFQSQPMQWCSAF